MTDTTHAALTAVQSARTAKTTADLAYLAAIEHARAEGLSYAEIGRAAGVSRQAMRQSMVKLASQTEEQLASEVVGGLLGRAARRT